MLYLELFSGCLKQDLRPKTHAIECFGDLLHKSIVLNYSKIDFVTPAFNGRFEAKLLNGEKVIISRQYVKVLKDILGI